MKTMSKRAAALLLLSGAAYAQVPSTNDTSDGFSNTGMGTGALIHITPNSLPEGYGNTAAGYDALTANTVGFLNSAFGSLALVSNTGIVNTAVGANSLASNTTGGMNTAIGYETLNDSTTGNGNIAVGFQAGFNVSTGNNNIEIGNEGVDTDGVEGGSGVIRIGTEGTQTKTFVAGIANTKITGKEVVITSDGQLGVRDREERHRTEIEPMGMTSKKLQQLRPVAYRLTTEPQAGVHYGLIAEEVAEVYPELVTRDENGRVDGVRYDELAPMLLNEVQKQQRVVSAQASQITAAVRRAAAQDAKIASLERQLTGIQAALANMQSTDQLVAKR